jgi:hypothetical protein
MKKRRKAKNIKEKAVSERNQQAPKMYGGRTDNPPDILDIHNIHSEEITHAEQNHTQKAKLTKTNRVVQNTPKTATNGKQWRT